MNGKEIIKKYNSQEMDVHTFDTLEWIIDQELKRQHNAAIDEAVKVADKMDCEADGYHTCEHNMDISDKIKELKQ